MAEYYTHYTAVTYGAMYGITWGSFYIALEFELFDFSVVNAFLESKDLPIRIDPIEVTPEPVTN